jgi:CubicO group peptidase (beta-lactamase class C family)
MWLSLLVLLAIASGCKKDSVNTALDRYCDDQGCISIKQFSANIDDQLKGKVAGYVSAVGVGLPVVVEEGLARTQADAPSRKMDTDTPIQIASVTKLLTTIAVLQSLDKHQLTVDSPIAPFLPSDWTQGPNVGSITFGELLSHRAGFRSAGDSKYATLKQQIADGVTLANKAQPMYNNDNFALFRVLLPFMEEFNDPGPAMRPTATANFYIDHMRKHVFEPVGVTVADCKPTSPSKTALYYPVPPGNTKGIEAGDWTAICGGGGWVLTASDLFKILLSLTSDNRLLTDAQKTLMNSDCLGWDCSVQTQTNFRGKNGLLLYNNNVNLQTFVGIFKGKVIAIVLTNSNPGANITGIVANAFNNAGVPKP